MAGFRKDTPSAGDVHVDGPDWKAKGAASKVGAEAAALARAAVVAKGTPEPLYVYRPVVNGDALIAWAKGQGFETTLPADELHVTIAYSRAPVDWMAAGESWSSDPKGQLKVAPGGPRQLARFGPLGDAAVLLFASSELKWRHEWLEEIGCSWDWAEFSPHITFSFNAPDLDLSTLEPYQGEIIFGPECFEPLVDNWKDSLVEKSFDIFCKADSVDLEHGLVFGWAIVCKDEDGKIYKDTQGNDVPEPAMLDAALDFSKAATAGDMHVRMGAGNYPFMFPLTAEIAKALGIDTKKTGLLVGCSPDPAMLQKFASGEYTGFSIGGEHLEINGKPVGSA